MLAIPGKEERQVSSLPKAANQLCCMLVTRSCLTLCDPMACSPPGSSVHGNSAGKNTGVGCHALLQGILPTLGSNPGLSHCRRILYYLNDQGSPRILVWVASLLQKNFPTQEWNRGPLHYRWIPYQVNYLGSPNQSAKPTHQMSASLLSTTTRLSPRLPSAPRRESNPVLTNQSMPSITSLFLLPLVHKKLSLCAALSWHLSIC